MDRIAQAFAVVKRADFVRPQQRPLAGVDAPLPIGHAQTNSQPSTVRLMLEWLDPQPGERVLDVGAGSGWTSALLAHLVGPKGEVLAVERIAELLEFGRSNCQRAGISNVEFVAAGKQLGLPEQAPFDRILVSAAATELPEELVRQLAPGGRMVIPVERAVWVIDKAGDDLEITRHPGFVFVPLLKE